MIDDAFDSVDKLTHSANGLGMMTPAAIWAFVALILMAYVWWSKKRELESNKEWQKIRNDQIASETSQTEVLKQVVNELVNMKMLITKYLLKE